MNKLTDPANKSFIWKIGTILVVSAATFIFIFTKPLMTQDPVYHQFIDQRAFWGIPNAQDVLSNVFFLIVGFMGFAEINKKKSFVSPSWIAFFISIILVGPGSAYYHWSPNNFTLVWDRLPMSLAFMALYVILLSEHVSLKCIKFLPWALLAGIMSVLTWVVTTDLRLYFWIQFSSFITVPIILILFPSRFSHKGWYAITLLAYALAKISEVWDKKIFDSTNEFISGHSLKHILAALGLAGLWWMVKVRKEILVAASSGSVADAAPLFQEPS